jgi:glycosyltransferase involved in cell wall biosynthesis
MQTLRSTRGAGVGGAGGRPDSLLELVTPLIITFNEAPNLERTLRQLTWARRIVVVDSFSTDETLDMLKAYPQMEVYQRAFDSFAGQCNFGLGKVDTEWVLSIDADYVVTDELIEELRSLPARTEADGFAARFKYCVWGQPLRGTLYPPRTVLYRTVKATYVDDGHAHHVVVSGPRAELTSFIHHDDRKPLSRWTSSQAKYVEAEARKFSPARSGSLSLSDRLRKRKVLAPAVVLCYCLVLHRGLLDGWAGWYYAFERALAEVLLALRLIEQENLAGRQVDGDWVCGQNERAAGEASRLRAGAPGRLDGRDRLRRLKVIAPVLMLPYTLLLCGGLFNGWRGWHAAYRQTFFELLLAIHLIEREHIVGHDLRPEKVSAALSPSQPGGAE